MVVPNSSLVGPPSASAAADALATIFLHAEVARHGPLGIDGLTIPPLADAARVLRTGAGDPAGNYHRRTAIEELRRLGADRGIADALAVLNPTLPGAAACNWEPVGAPIDEPDPAKPGARRVAFALRVERSLDAQLREILDPQAWDDYSGYMQKVHVVDERQATSTPAWTDVPETATPPKKGSPWSTKPAGWKLFERFAVPLAMGGATFLQTFDIEMGAESGATPYHFAYELHRCRWSKVLLLPGAEGGIARNQGSLEAREQGRWTHVAVQKSLQLEPRGPYSGDSLTRMATALLKAGWRQELVRAVTHGCR